MGPSEKEVKPKDLSKNNRKLSSNNDDMFERADSQIDLNDENNNAASNVSN
jgi:hypothetical protein